MAKNEKPAYAGFSSLLELAINIPYSYTDTRLSKELETGKVNTVEAEVIHVSKLAKRLHVKAKIPIWQRFAQITIFNPKPYHYSIFKPGSRQILQAKVELFGNTVKMVNPKKISIHGKIVPRYRCKQREDIHRRVVRESVTLESLMDEGLDESRARLILSAHAPDQKWFELYKRNGGIGPKTVEALKFAEALDHFVRMRKKRRRFKAKERVCGDISSFLNRLPFELTDDQKRVVGEIREDFRSGTAARRMIVGDVGSGKTMVILASAMTIYPHVSILMAPTSILALQLYEEAKTWLPEFFKTALVTNSLEHGNLHNSHLIIGTHALLYRDLPDALLIMVDEQHRFGTQQRKRLEELVSRKSDKGEKPHFLQFSATPIPRTQAMLDSALIDVSLIESVPFKKDITTKIVGRRDFGSLKEHIKRETDNGRQVLVVYPLVEESEHVGYRSLERSESFWKRNFDGVYVTHGKDRRKEDVLSEFAEKGKILLATTVIEVGISLPKLSTIVIAGAERMGLATLHQLRGRVSRTGLKGYCFLFTNTPESERLKAFAKTVNGFEIARLDLEFRKSGDILCGSVQSGKGFLWLDMAKDEDIVREARRRAQERVPHPF